MFAALFSADGIEVIDEVVKIKLSQGDACLQEPMRVEDAVSEAYEHAGYDFLVHVFSVQAFLLAASMVVEHDVVHKTLFVLFNQLPSFGIEFLQVRNDINGEGLKGEHHLPRYEQHFIDGVMTFCGDAPHNGLLVFQVFLNDPVNQLPFVFKECIDGLFRHAQFAGNVVEGDCPDADGKKHFSSPADYFLYLLGLVVAELRGVHRAANVADKNFGNSWNVLSFLTNCVN